MRADQVEVSWDAGKGKWLVRIVNGEEVISALLQFAEECGRKGSRRRSAENRAG